MRKSRPVKTSDMDTYMDHQGRKWIAPSRARMIKGLISVTSLKHTIFPFDWLLVTKVGRRHTVCMYGYVRSRSPAGEF